MSTALETDPSAKRTPHGHLCENGDPGGVDSCFCENDTARGHRRAYLTTGEEICCIFLLQCAVRGSVQSGFPLFEAQPQPAEHPFEWPWVQDDFSRPAVANEDVANEDVEPRRRARR